MVWKDLVQARDYFYSSNEYKCVDFWDLMTKTDRWAQQCVKYSFVLHSKLIKPLPLMT